MESLNNSELKEIVDELLEELIENTIIAIEEKKSDEKVETVEVVEVVEVVEDSKLIEIVEAVETTASKIVETIEKPSESIEEPSNQVNNVVEQKGVVEFKRPRISLQENLRIEQERRKQQMLQWNIQKEINTISQAQPVVVEQPVQPQPSTSNKYDTSSAWESEHEDVPVQCDATPAVEKTEDESAIIAQNNSPKWDSEEEGTHSNSISPSNNASNDVAPVLTRIIKPCVGTSSSKSNNSSNSARQSNSSDRETSNYSNNYARKSNNYYNGTSWNNSSNQVPLTNDRTSFEHEPNKYSNKIVSTQNGYNRHSNNSNNSKTSYNSYKSRTSYNSTSWSQNERTTSLSSVHVATTPQETTDYEWINSELPINTLAPPDVLQGFGVRMKPRNFDVCVDNRIHQMKQTEYLICYCNELTAIGMIKNQNDIKDQPLSMQFGSWKSQDGKNMYVGCTVLVKSYATVCDRAGKPKKIADKNCSGMDLIKDGCIFSNTIAKSWAITNKPKYVPSIGVLRQFSPSYQPDGTLKFSGRIYDQENGMEFRAVDDIWPYYITTPLALHTVVIIRWIKIEEPFLIFTSKHGLKIMLPTYATTYISGAIENTDPFFITKVDTRYSI